MGWELVPVDSMVGIVNCVCGCVSVDVEARFLFLLWIFKYAKSSAVGSGWKIWK